MEILPILAHGTLGPWDELIFLGVSVIFVVMMGISWVRSQAMEPDLPDEASSDTDNTKPKTDAPDRFKLD